MLWFFERATQKVSLETRYDNDRGEYVAIVIDADGHETTERFPDPDTFRRWLIAWETAIKDDRWRPTSGSPVVLPDGWPDRRPPK